MSINKKFKETEDLLENIVLSLKKKNVSLEKEGIYYSIGGFDTRTRGIGFYYKDGRIIYSFSIRPGDKNSAEPMLEKGSVESVEAASELLIDFIIKKKEVDQLPEREILSFRFF